MRTPPVLVWFRHDLRLADHPALHAAVAAKHRVFCFYILDEASEGLRPRGAASRWWLHHTLARLDESLQAFDGRLHLFRGEARSVLAQLVTAIEPAALHFNRRYQAAERTIDAAIAADCEAGGVAVHDHPGSVLHEPWEIAPKTGGFYKVFTPYWRAAQAKEQVAPPLPAPKRMTAEAACPTVANGPLDLVALDLLPKISWAAEFDDTWTPGEAGAQAALRAFIADRLDDYAEGRDRLGIVGSSRLSPHLRFGEVSPRQVFDAIDRTAPSAAAAKFKAEVGWRDFNTALLFHVPDLATRPFHRQHEHFPHAQVPPADLDAWRRGRTGYPIVDAGMRQLWRTGTMDNRVRMIAASFLVKHLLADWRLGERWFWDTLCDADPANNAVNWQWVAGCGNDPVPYFRIFNPVLQGEKFDSDGAYVRRYVGELTDVPAQWIHKPWDAPRSVLTAAGVTLGKTYPHPIVDHAKARARALAALAEFRKRLT